MAPPRTHYSAEEKLHLLANLDLEVAHRTRQFEAWLVDRLENFNIHQQGQISRIPKQVRSMTMRQFGEKYNGNVQEALRGVQRERMAAAGLDANFAEIDKSERKRKWVASQEVEPGSSASGSSKDPTESRSAKNARLMPAMSPKKPPPSIGHGNAQRSRLLTSNKTPATPQTMNRIPPSPSPQKSRPPFVTGMSSLSRSTSPTKHPASRQPTSRVPSSSTFNPALPPKTPSYPASAPKGVAQSATLRFPRRDESMLSVNGSPLANPYQFGLGWFKGVEMGQDVDTDVSVAAGQTRKLKRTKSNIIVRRDPSLLTSDHSGTGSQPTHYATPEGTSTNHSREQSQSSHPYSSKPPSYSSQFPDPQAFIEVQATPKPTQSLTSSFSALVAIPTKDGHLLEFDPLQTSPRALEALEGISDSAKKQARLEMGHLVQTAVEKWKIR